MKRNLLIIVYASLIMLGQYHAMAQCTGGSLSCCSITSFTSSFQTISFQHDVYKTFPAIAGRVYTFSYCSADGGSTAHDTEITIQNNSGVAVAGGYNDDSSCGLASYLVWTAPSTGTFRILTSEFGCVLTTNVSTLAYKETVPAQIPLPAQTSTFSGNVRGFWFTSPVNTVISGLRVPVSAGAGTQNIHIMKFSTAPPEFSAITASYTTLAYIQGAQNGVIQSVNINVAAGDIIGILGQAGTESSYGPIGPYSSTIAGNAVTLTRLIYQGSISGGPAGDVSSESGAALGRVEVYYLPPSLATEPTAQPTALNFTSVTSTSFTVNYTAAAGSPAGYIAVRTSGATAPNTDPVDGTAYTVGAALGNGTIAFVGSAVTFNQTGLTAGTQYNYKIYAYNGSGSTINYRQTTPLTGNRTTASSLATEPTAQPTALNFTSITSSSFTASYTAAAGSPAGYIAVRTSGATAPNTDPVDGTAYTVGAALGNGTVAFVGSAVTFNQTGLTASTQYNYKIYSYNGSGTTINYRQTTPLTGNTATASSLATEPTSQPTVFSTTSITSSSFTVSYTAATGTPAGYIAVRKSGSASTTDPADGTTYTVGATLGDAIIAYVGTAITFNEAELAASTQYFYKIYTYNGTGTATNYLQTTPLQGNVTTLAPPPATENLAFKSVTTSVTDDLKAIRFASTQTAYAVGTNGAAIKSIDAGSTWAPLTVPAGAATATLWNVFFTSLNTGYIVGDAGLIIKTTNGGSSWTTLSSGITNDLYDIAFPTPNIGYMVGAAGTIIKTIDAGATWVALSSGVTGNFLNSVVFLDALIGVAAGPNGIIRTIDGGATWNSVTTQSIEWLSFPSSTVGYGVGDGGVIVKTLNAGLTWTPLTSNTSETLWGAYFTSTNIGFAVGENGTVIKTANGGSTWINTTTDFFSEHLYAVHFGTNERGITVGNFGTILITEAELPPISISASNFKNEIPAAGNTTVSITIPTTDVARVDAVNAYVFAIRDIANDIFTNGEIVPAVLSSNTYTATIQDTGDDPIGYYYFFEIAYDGFNRYISSDEGYAYLKYENTNTLKLPSLKAGSTANDYQIISVPLVLTNAQVGAVFDEFGAADNKQWRMFTYQSGNTTPLSINGSITPGKGYWLITKTATTIDVGPGKTVAANGESPFSLSLVAGWNLIGNPYNFGVTWNAGTDLRELKQFSSGTYSTSITMQPFVGYFVFANTAGNYPIPVTGPFIGGRTRTNRFDQTETSWELPITLQRGDLKNELGGIGMHQEADAGFDAFDEPALPIPTMQNMFAMIFDRPDLPYTLNKEVVPANQNYTWNFTIDQPEGNDVVELHWDPMLLTKLKNKLYLYDEAKLEVVDMMQKSMHYTLANSTITIIYGDEFYIKNALAVKDARIAQPYPNPASESMQIPVVLPEAGLVSLHMHDSYGRSIYESEQFYDQGNHRISIQNLNEVPSGIYFVTAKILSGANSHRKTFKIVINQNTK